MIGLTPAMAETAWYAGDLDRVRTIVTPAPTTAEEQGEPWHLGELAHWLSPTGVPTATPVLCQTPRAELGGSGLVRAAQRSCRLLIEGMTSISGHHGLGQGVRVERVGVR